MPTSLSLYHNFFQDLTSDYLYRCPIYYLQIKTNPAPNKDLITYSILIIPPIPVDQKMSPLQPHFRTS